MAINQLKHSNKYMKKTLKHLVTGKVIGTYTEDCKCENPYCEHLVTDFDTLMKEREIIKKEMSKPRKSNTQLHKIKVPNTPQVFERVKAKKTGFIAGYPVIVIKTKYNKYQVHDVYSGMILTPFTSRTRRDCIKETEERLVKAFGSIEKIKEMITIAHKSAEKFN